MIITNGETATHINKYLPLADIKYFSSKNDLNESEPQEILQSDLIIILGGPQFVSEIEKYPYLIKVVNLLKTAISKNIPIIGICLGMHLIAKALDIKVTGLNQLNIGFSTLLGHTKLFYCHNEGIKNDSELQEKINMFDEISYNQSNALVLYFRMRNIMGIQMHPDIDPDLIGRFSPFSYLADEAIRCKNTINEQNRNLMLAMIDKIIGGIHN